MSSMEKNAAGDQLGSPAADGEGMASIPADMLEGAAVGDTYTVTSVDSDNVMLKKQGDQDAEDASWKKGAVDSAPPEM